MNDGADNYSRYINGDDEGLADIIREYKNGLMLYINSIVKNIHTAEDLTEDTFVKLAVKKPRYRKKYTFKAWLYSIGKNTALDYCRKYSKELDIDNIDEHKEIYDEENAERNLIKNEDKIELMRVMKELTPEHRQVLYLKYIEQLDNNEISVITGKSKRQTEQLLYSAKNSLRKKLEKGGFQYEKQ